jgi:hypothetical protein
VRWRKKGPGLCSVSSSQLTRSTRVRGRAGPGLRGTFILIGGVNRDKCTPQADDDDFDPDAGTDSRDADADRRRDVRATCAVAEGYTSSSMVVNRS